MIFALAFVFPAHQAGAAKRSEKQLEMDRQREEMRRQAEERRLNPDKAILPPMSPTGRSLIIPPSSTGRAAEPASPAVPQPPTTNPVARLDATPAVPAAVPSQPAAPAVPAVPAAAVGRAETPEEMIARAIGTPSAAAAPALEALPSGAGGNGAAGDALLAHASFQRGAKLFNVALDIYRRFQADRNPARLREVSVLSEQAARSFEECRAAFPGDARIPKYVEQCYGLTRYARQSELMNSATAPR